MAAYYGSSGGGSDRWDNRDRVSSSSSRYGSNNGNDRYSDRYGSSDDRYAPTPASSDRYGPPPSTDRYGPGGGSSYDRYGASDKYGPSGGGSGWGDRTGDRSNDSMAGLGGSLSNIQWDISRLPVFEKNFYIEHPDVSKRSERDAEEWRRSVDITVIGRGIPKVDFLFYLLIFCSL